MRDLLFAHPYWFGFLAIVALTLIKECVIGVANAFSRCSCEPQEEEEEAE